MQSILMAQKQCQEANRKSESQGGEGERYVGRPCMSLLCGCHEHTEAGRAGGEDQECWADRITHTRKGTSTEVCMYSTAWSGDLPFPAQPQPHTAAALTALIAGLFLILLCRLLLFVAWC